jgi:hypothetical protein
MGFFDALGMSSYEVRQAYLDQGTPAKRRRERPLTIREKRAMRKIYRYIRRIRNLQEREK